MLCFSMYPAWPPPAPAYSPEPACCTCRRYVNAEPFSAKALLAETSAASPVFFVLFPGYSPSAQIEAYARTGEWAELGRC